jgi:carotenoid 1,2-hydratase
MENVTSTPPATGNETAAMQVLSAATQPAPWHQFDTPLAPGGYRWWYVDALSDDHQHGVTVIVMLGSVFSPYYAASRRRQQHVDPLEHTALNVALYGRPARWALTERDRSAVTRAADRLRIGPSEVRWDGEALEIRVSERTAPLARRLEGVLRVRPRIAGTDLVELNPSGRHCWWPISPLCDVTVDFRHPQLRWHGHGYLDSNFGDESLEAGFRRWDWARTHTGHDGRTTILYNVETHAREERALALTIDEQGHLTTHPPLPRSRAARGVWGVDRPTRADRDAQPRVTCVLEDTPFYTRSVLETRLYGETVHAMHESLDLERFTAPWVQALIPFRNPRRTARPQPPAG